MINILIVNWNSSDKIEKLLSSIIKSNYKDIRIISIDNASAKEDLENLVKLYNDFKETINIHLLCNNENLGYAGGNNKGYEYLIKKSFEGNILIVNPDIILEENTIEELQKNILKDVAIVMCRTMTTDYKHLYDFILLKGLKQFWLTTDNIKIESDYAAGSCMLLNRKVIDKIGLFNEDYFLYWEEVDLSLRARKNEYKIISTTATSIYRENNSKERSLMSLYYLTRNVFILKKNENVSNYELLRYLCIEMILGIYRTVRLKEYRYLKYYFKGIIDGIGGKVGKYE